MKKWISVVTFIMALLNVESINAQYNKTDSTYSKHYIGSSLFVLANLIPDDNSPDFFQLNYGYRLNAKNNLSIELKTWKYAWSLGIPYGNSFEAPQEKFPGYIREFGVAVAYQHYWWKGFYTGIHVMNAWQNFKNEENKKVGNGFQLFNTYRTGYHFKLFKDKFFIEPSIAITHRPFYSKMPNGFKQLDDKWPKYLIGEPGLHFGINF